MSRFLIVEFPICEGEEPSVFVASESEVSNRIDIADNYPNAYRIMYLTDDGDIVECLVGEHTLVPDAVEDRPFVFATAPLTIADPLEGRKTVGTVSFTDH